MKRVKFLAIGIFICLFGISQEYVPFPDTNAIWSQLYTNQQPYVIDYYQYGISGDTLINNQTYKKVYRLNDTVYPLNLGQFCGAIREDSSKRIFAICCSDADPSINDDDEVILYDFSRSVGDTVFVGLGGIGPINYLIISEIDSILIGNNYRKIFYFNLYEHFWIEGIGSSRGLFSPLITLPTGFMHWYFICLNKNNEVIYLNPDFENCFPVITSIKKNKNSAELYKITPNPAKNTIHILASSGTKIYNVTFYNQTSQQTLIINAPSNTLDISSLKPGLYFAEIKTSEGDVMKKIIVQ